MRSIILIVIYMASFCQTYCQVSKQKEWMDLIKSSDFHLKNAIVNKGAELTSVDSVMQKVISAADQTFLLQELTTIVNICSEYFNGSDDISLSLTGWLKESHPIYATRTPTEANQFRGFLLSSLSKFPPNDELYKYVKYELLFGGHAFNIAAAAAVAKNFTDQSQEIIPLMEPYLSSSFRDQWVDITTPELNYPVVNPTKARYEIILTLIAYGASAFRSVKLLDYIVESNNFGSFEVDSALHNKAERAAKYLRKITPECCQKETVVEAGQRGMVIIDKKNRKAASTSNLKLVDQEGRSLKFVDLRSKPFVLTFFYTQCANPLKCISTVHRLGELEAECIKNNMAHKVGLYGMTYDPDFDTPPILKKYGELYGVEFNKNMKFLKTADNSVAPLSNQLQLRVSYGAGSVNQHGLQLFVFDKKGRLAAVCDNDLWEVSDVYKVLIQLIKE